MKRTITRALLVVLAAALPFVAGCTNKEGESEATVTIVPTIAGTNPLIVNINVSQPLQLNSINLTSHFKNPTATDPQHFQDVTISRYVVTYSRVDGGTRVPAAETFGGFVLVPSGGAATFVNPPIMYAYALQQAPFDSLLPFNGGVDPETGRTEIDLVAKIVFFGETVAGERVQSEPVISESLVFVAQ